MKAVLCLILGLGLGTIAKATESTNTQERGVTLEISVIRSSLKNPQHAIELASRLRQAWVNHNNLGSRAANFATLAAAYLNNLRDAGNNLIYDPTPQWSVVVSEKALHHPTEFFAIFQVRYYLYTYIVRLFSTKI